MSPIDRMVQTFPHQINERGIGTVPDPAPTVIPGGGATADVSINDYIGTMGPATGGLGVPISAVDTDRSFIIFRGIEVFATTNPGMNLPRWHVTLNFASVPAGGGIATQVTILRFSPGGNIIDVHFTVVEYL